VAVVCFVLKPVGQRFLKHIFADFVAMEKIVRASRLDRTIVRPPKLTDKTVHRSLPDSVRSEPAPELHGVQG
jgi:NAD(P)H-binding